MSIHSRSHGFSSSDTIALAVGGPTGVLTFVGVLLAYLGYRKKRRFGANLGSVGHLKFAGGAYVI
jgi:hypothetical protein